MHGARLGATAACLTLAAGAAAPGARDDTDWHATLRVQSAHERFDGVHTVDGHARDATWLRRADLALSVVHGDWQLAATLDAELDGRATARVDDWALGWQAAPGVLWRVGRFDPDFGLSRSMGASAAPLPEDAALWDLAPDAGDGGGAHGLQLRLDAPRWHASAAVIDRGQDRSVDARLVRHGLALGPGQALLGVSLQHRPGWRGDGRLRSRLGVRGSDETDDGRRVTLAPAGNHQGSTALALEAAWMQPRLLVHAEWLGHWMAAEAGPTRVARGWMAGVAWMLAGPARAWATEGARPDRPRPGSGDAAWELVLAWSELGVARERTAKSGLLGMNLWLGRRTRGTLAVQRSWLDAPVGPGLTQGTAWLARWQWRY